MAGFQGDRTEKPTTKRLKEARERGQVARSRDLAASLSLGAITLALGWFGYRMIAAVADRLTSGLSGLGDHARAAVEPIRLASIMWSDAGLLASVVGPPAILAALASVLASIAQIGWQYSPKAVHANWSRLNPAQGFSRLGAKQAGPELAKAAVGLSALGFVCYVFVRAFYDQAPVLMGMTPAESARMGWARVWGLLWRASLVLTALGVADYGLQRWRWLSGLKMTRQEVRDEAKLHDGSPEIKARVRRVQREMTRRRMLQAVKNATVIITNPTHFAVALEYRRTEMPAPKVLAKGQDLMAERIKAVARKHGIPMVENVTLARALYKTAEIGDTIPAALFGAVAEVLAYLVRLRQLVL
jgi:flagellar biosynthetic protein FlhB